MKLAAYGLKVTDLLKSPDNMFRVDVGTLVGKLGALLLLKVKNNTITADEKNIYVYGLGPGTEMIITFYCKYLSNAMNPTVDYTDGQILEFMVEAIALGLATKVLKNYHNLIEIND